MAALRDGLYRYLMLDRDPLGKRGKPPASKTAEARQKLAEPPKVKTRSTRATGYAAVREKLEKKD